MSTTAYIGLGGNLGDPQQQLCRALDALAVLPSTQVVACSRFYRSPAWGPVSQPDFLNAVCALSTTLEPEALMQELLDIERAAGRERGERWGPRLLDLDLLMYGDRALDTDVLQLPHPRMHERPFVLLPLAELAPDLVLSTHGPLHDLLARVDCSGVEVQAGR